MKEHGNATTGSEQGKRDEDPMETTLDTIIEALNKDPNKFINGLIPGGHAVRRHVDKTQIDVLNRTLQNSPPEDRKKNFSASAFATEDDFYEYVALTLQDNAKRIVEWLQDPTQKPKSFETSTPGEFTGYGFKYSGDLPSVFRCQSSTCHVELSKKERQDPSQPYTVKDIRLVTAYPIITGDKGKRQVKDLRPLIWQTSEYQSASATRQAWLDYIGNDPDTAVAYSKENKCLFIYFGQEGENRIIIGKKPSHYVLAAQEDDMDTLLLQEIRNTDDLPESQMTFPLNADGPARKVMYEKWPEILRVADGLRKKAQENLELKHKETRRRLSPKSKTADPEPIPKSDQPEPPASCKPKKKLKRTNRKCKKALTATNITTRPPGQVPKPKTTDTQEPEPIPAPAPTPQATYSALSQEQAIQQQAAGLLNRSDSSVRRFLQESERLNVLQEEQQKKPKNNKYDE